MGLKMEIDARNEMKVGNFWGFERGMRHKRSSGAGERGFGRHGPHGARKPSVEGAFLKRRKCEKKIQRSSGKKKY